jgi:hypothetical protein
MTKQELVREARSYLRKLYRNRTGRGVTADDVHRFMTKEGVRLTPNQRMGLIQSVLRGDERLYAADLIPSQRNAARYRKITEWLYTS